MEELLAFGRKVAGTMMRGYVDDIVSAAVYRACRTFDPSRGVPLRRWIARLVRQDVQYEWRVRASRREQHKADAYWEAVEQPQEEESEWSEGYCCLCEKYLDGWCMDVIARRHKRTVSEVKQLMAEALADLEKRR